MRTVCSHQPVFLPWIGWWHKAISAGTVVVPTGLKISSADDRLAFRTKVEGDRWCTLPRWGDLGTYAETTIDRDAVSTIKQTLWEMYGSKKHKYAERVEWVLGSPGWHEHTISNVCTGLNRSVASVLGVAIDMPEVLSVGDGASRTERMFNRVLTRMRPPFTYLMGRGSLAYFDEKYVPEDVHVMVQVFNRSVPDLTILALLADEPDPLDVIMSSAKFVPLEAAR